MLVRLYHHKLYVWLFLSGISLWQTLPFSDLFDGTSFSVFVLGAQFGSIVLAALTIVQEVKHKPAICIECMHQVPTDAIVVARKKQKSLRNYHSVMEKPGKYILFAIVAIGLSVIQFFIDSPFWEFMVKVPLIVYWVGISFHFYNVDLHNKVKSFCPYCKGDGEYDPRPERVPDPFGTKNK